MKSETPEVWRAANENNFGPGARQGPQGGPQGAPTNKRRVQLTFGELAGTKGQAPASALANGPSGQRLAAPRLSLLGKPIYLSSHKCHYRNTASMRWKMRLRAFLEQPQGPLAWLYHSSL